MESFANATEVGEPLTYTRQKAFLKREAACMGKGKEVVGDEEIKKAEDEDKEIYNFSTRESDTDSEHPNETTEIPCIQLFHSIQ